MTTIDLFVVLAILYFCYLGKQLVEMVRQEINPPQENKTVIPEQWYDEIRWKDQ